MAVGDFSTALRFARNDRGGDVRRSDFRLAVWLVAYVSLAVSSIVLGDFSTPIRFARNDRGGKDLRKEV